MAAKLSADVAVQVLTFSLRTRLKQKKAQQTTVRRWHAKLG